MARIVGTNGNDVLVGTKHRDVIIGKGGKDVIKGKGGNDVIKGGAGKDKIIGGSGNDKIKGQSGSDLIKGNSGNDKLDGGTGDDRLIGGSGNDKLDGGPGFDDLFGNSGADIFKFQRGDGLWPTYPLSPNPAGDDFNNRVFDYQDGTDKFDVPNIDILDPVTDNENLVDNGAGPGAAFAFGNSGSNDPNLNTAVFVVGFDVSVFDPTDFI